MPLFPAVTDSPVRLVPTKEYLETRSALLFLFPSVSWAILKLSDRSSLPFGNPYCLGDP